jgi:membrane protein YdbS with pleckstrin-like domain
MRWLQIAFFLLGTIAFLTSLFFIGRQTGQDLWRAGIAFMLGDVVVIMLWPRKPQ